MFWYPHINDGSAGRANYFTGSWDASSAYCQKCASAYRLLDLSNGASKERVKSKKWAFAELFSADRLRSMSAQARQLAEEQHKSINAACDQILRCPVCARLRDDLDASESRPAPYQPKSAMTARRESRPKQENSKPQPDKSSLAQQVIAILKEAKNKINAIAFVREQTGWDRKEASDFVDSIAPEWHHAPEPAAGATRKQSKSKPQPSAPKQAANPTRKQSKSKPQPSAPKPTAGATRKQAKSKPQPSASQPAADATRKQAKRKPPAPEQAVGAKAKPEETKAQPEKHSRTEEVDAILKEPKKKTDAGTFAREQKDFADSVAPEWRPAPEQAAVAKANHDAFAEAGPGRFSLRMTIYVMVLALGTLVACSLYSRYRAQMVAEERQQLYVEQKREQAEQIERVKEEQLRQQQEACAERGFATRGRSVHKALRIKQSVWHTSP